MSDWNDDELTRIADARELRVAGRRADGSLRPSVPIWHVRVGDSLFVRSVRGADAAWFRGTLVRHEGRIESAGIALDVTFARDDTKDREVDEAYAAKYGDSSSLASIVAPLASATTLRVEPL